MGIFSGLFLFSETVNNLLGELKIKSMTIMTFLPCSKEVPLNIR